MTLLQVHGISKHFGALRAVSDVSFQVEQGEIVSIIGPNGAGKSTLLNLITQVVPATHGKVLYKGIDLSGRKKHHLASHGIARTFQTVRLFHANELTVMENIMIGCSTHYRHGMMASSFRFKKARENEREIRQRAEDILEFIGIGYLADTPVGELAFGNQRLAEFGRAIAARPDILILDEPAAGLNDIETEKFSALIKEINKQGIAVLLVEHHMGLVMEISNRIVVLNYGEKLVEGTPSEIQNDPRVIEAYLGKEAAQDVGA